MAGIRLEYPAGYYARARRSSLELHHVDLGLIEDGIDDELHAICRAQEHDESIKAEEREAAENAAEYAADDLRVAA